jgi:hypothetical protein
VQPKALYAVLLFSMSALPVEILAAFSLWFSPGWANGWPFGLSRHVVWSSGLALATFAILMTVAAGVGAAGCGLLLGSQEKAAITWGMFAAWLLVWMVPAALLCWVIGQELHAAAVQIWP